MDDGFQKCIQLFGNNAQRNALNNVRVEILVSSFRYLENILGKAPIIIFFYEFRGPSRKGLARNSI